MFFDGQVKAAGAELQRPPVDGYEEALGVEGAGLLTIALEPVGALNSGHDSNEIPQVPGQSQLGKADLVVDLEPPGLQRDLDRAIDPRVGDVMGVGGEGKDQAEK
jgi:hypothetical protein